MQFANIQHTHFTSRWYACSNELCSKSGLCQRGQSVYTEFHSIEKGLSKGVDALYVYM